MDERIPKSTHPQTNLLVHDIYLICKTFMNNLTEYLHQLISTVKFEIFNDFKIMPSKERVKNYPQEFGHVCVDQWFPQTTRPHSF